VAAVMTPAEFAAAMNLVAPVSPSGLPAQPGQYIEYSSVVGDRWDTIAYTYYGDATMINPLIMANPGVPIVDVLDPGTEIAIPIITQAEGGVTSNPPWAS
jgi:phage tail protein X